MRSNRLNRLEHVEVEEAFSAWLAARRAGESVVVVAPDHATVDALALRARAVRVAAGEVEAGGLLAGAQVVGRGDEIVSCHNDRRLVTTAGVWVRNGDRWRVHDAERAVAHIREVEAAIARRSEWLLSHPTELAWEAELATRLAERRGNELEAAAPHHDNAEPDYDLEELLRSVDLRTIDLGARLPRAGIERTTGKSLGLSRRAEVPDIELPPLPGHGLDAGPDLGLGL